MAYTKTTWLQRVREFASRVTLIPTGNPDEYDLSRVEGAVAETGTPFSVAVMQNIEDGVEDAHNRIDNIVIDTDSTINNSNLTGATLTQALNNTLRDDEVKIGNAVISGDAGINNIAIGKTATVASTATDNNIVIGTDATTANGTGTIAIGRNAKAQASDGIAIGDGSDVNVGAIFGICIGPANVGGSEAVAIGGLNTRANNLSATALGTNARATANYAIGIGNFSRGNTANGIAIGRDAFSGSVSNNSIALGYGASCSVGDDTVAIGKDASAINDNIFTLGIATSDVRVPGTFTVTGTKNFEIPHPNPSKIETHKIRHACVESPTAGDTLYRFTVQSITDGEIVEVQLPDYFEHLNINTDVWVNGKNHFGRAYGQVVADKLLVTCELAGEYNVLVIGTRNDDAVQDWYIKGAEREIGESWLGETYAFEVDEIIQVTEIMEV